VIATWAGVPSCLPVKVAEISLLENGKAIRAFAVARFNLMTPMKPSVLWPLFVRV
jgi:hypothetical protein